MNTQLLEREAAAELGALDPKPEPTPVLSGPTRLLRIVDEDVEVIIDPTTGRTVDMREIDEQR